MECIHDLCTERELDTTQIKSECCQWIRLLIQCVDFTSVVAETHLREFTMNSLFKKKFRREVDKSVSAVHFMLNEKAPAVRANV